MERFYRNMIRWNLPSSEKRHAEEIANYVGHELVEQEITGEELETEIETSYHRLKELHEEANITIDEWAQWVRDGIEDYESWLLEDI